MKEVFIINSLYVKTSLLIFLYIPDFNVNRKVNETYMTIGQSITLVFSSKNA